MRPASWPARVPLVAALCACSDGTAPFVDATRETGTSDLGKLPDTEQPVDAAPVADVPTGLDANDAGDAADGAADDTNSWTPESGPRCDASTVTCTPGPAGCGTTEICDDGLDNDCDRSVDEGCACLPGTVQTCFAGPPGSRRVGACADGTQRCVGTTEFGT